jgi:hypothetical protein
MSCAPDCALATCVATNAIAARAAPPASKVLTFMWVSPCWTLAVLHPEPSEPQSVAGHAGFAKTLGTIDIPPRLAQQGYAPRAPRRADRKARVETLLDEIVDWRVTLQHRALSQGGLSGCESDWGGWAIPGRRPPLRPASRACIPVRASARPFGRSWQVSSSKRRSQVVADQDEPVGGISPCGKVRSR